MRGLLAISAICLATLAHAQLSVEHLSVGVLPSDAKIRQVGNRLIVQSPGTLNATLAELILVKTEAANVEVAATDQARVPIEVEEISRTQYLIDKPGKYWVEVTAIDFGKNIYGRKTVVVEVGQGPNPPPGPGPTPPTPDVVPDKYGLGSVAFSNAPRDSVTVDKYARIYKQAGDFLFGVPSLKFIVSSNASHASDPNRSVMAWIAQETAAVQCTNEQVCQQWSAWRSVMAQALRDSQNKRQFTRQDWFNAFGEISQALQAVK